MPTFCFKGHIQDAVGACQLCGGQIVGIEAAILWYLVLIFILNMLNILMRVFASLHNYLHEVMTFLVMRMRNEILTDGQSPLERIDAGRMAPVTRMCTLYQRNAPVNSLYMYLTV